MWNISLQETRKGPVLIKEVKFVPSLNKKTGDVKFVRLKPKIFQMLVSNGKTTLRIKKIISNSSVKYVVQHPDTLDYPNIKIGVGKKKRIIPDVLAEKVVHTGVKFNYDNSEELSQELTRFMGETGGEVVNMLDAA
jgi:hypothetical protein